MTTQPGDDVVRLATASTPAQAHIWLDVLQGEGIQANVVGDYLDAGIGDIPGMRAELWVHRKDAERAQEILRAAKTTSSDSADEDEDPEEMPESV